MKARAQAGLKGYFNDNLTFQIFGGAMRISYLRRTLNLLLLGFFMVHAPGQAPEPESAFSFSGDAAFVSKYIWRGQRLTNDASVQPSMTMGIGGFSFNIWGNMDLTAVNAGDKLLLPQDTLATAASAGLKGKFSEVDYTFSYSQSVEKVSLDVGMIFYTFPERSASLASTTEIYGGLSFDGPLAPSATLYIDIDETGESGSNGVYFLLSGGHSIPIDNEVFSALDLSASLAFVNKGFSDFYYGAAKTGAHDLNLTVSLPITLSDDVSASAFVSYSSLLGGFRDYQFKDPREVLLGTAGTASDLANTVWAGLTLSLGF